MGMLDGWRFCPRCAAELERGAGKVTCPACGLAVYANPAATANALCMDERGRVLLARRAHDPDAGLWDIPGGFLDEGEHPLDGIRRELKEETGLEVVPQDFLCVTVDRYGDDPGATYTVNLTWTARVDGGEAAPADDVAELRWFAPDELPGPDELAFRNVAVVLDAWRQQYA